MMLVGVGCYVSRLTLKLAFAETASGKGRPKIRWWFHGLSIVVLAHPEHRSIAIVSAHSLMRAVYFANAERCQSRVCSVTVCRF